MNEILINARDWYLRFQGNSFHLTLFWITLLGLILWSHKHNKKTNYFLVLYSIFWMFIYICPITAKIIMDFCIGRDVYWRMIWILPYIVVIAYTAVNVIFDMKSKAKRTVALIGIITIITLTGTNIFSMISIDPSTGASKIPSHVGVICEELITISETQNENQINAVFPDDLTPYIRQYDASILMPYGRNVPKDVSHPIHDTLYAETFDYDMLVKQFLEYGCNYLVLHISHEANNILHETNGFTHLTNIDEYNIYHFNQ